MRNNPIQFAVVREDPLVEAAVIEKFNIKNVLMICSGGCSVLSLKSWFSDLNITALDLNQSQIDLTRDKLNFLNHLDYKKKFNIETAQSNGLNQCGNFESLFKGLREFIYDFILDHNQMRELFSDGKTKLAQSLLFEHRYWSVAFSLFFSDTILETMFGKAAIQHAPRGSYPRYFQQVFERGFNLPDAQHNYFLHHVFLGYYINEPHSLPHYLINPSKLNVNSNLNIHFKLGTIESMDDLSGFNLIQLSNIMDWMSAQENKALADYITHHTHKGTRLLIRQLNNEQPVTQYFPEFILEQEFSDELLSIDRSLFYSSILCLKRR